MFIRKQSTSHRGTKPKFKKFLAIILAIFFCITILHLSTSTTFADSTTIVETTFFGNLQDDGKGCGVYTVLNLAVDILSIGAGILGVVGITIVGIQYLTAGGNEQQTTKAKRRMLEIIIGLIAYAILYAFMQWLLPGGKFNTNITCQTVSDEQLKQMREEEQAARIEKAKQRANNSSDDDDDNNGSSDADSSIKASTGAESIAKAAALLAWPKGTPRKTWEHNYGGKKIKQWSDLGTAKPTQAFMDAFDELYPDHWSFEYPANIGADCGKFVKVVLKYAQKHAGIKDIPKWKQGFTRKFDNSKHWKKVSGANAQPGDICISSDHQKIYMGGKTVAEAGNHSKRFGHIHGGTDGSCKSYTVYRYVD